MHNYIQLKLLCWVFSLEVIALIIVTFEVDWALKNNYLSISQGNFPPCNLDLDVDVDELTQQSPLLGSDGSSGMTGVRALHCGQSSRQPLGTVGSNNGAL